MKKLNKIGVSALAGSLVAVSASAGDLSVSGTWQLTYKSDNNSNIANPFGSKSSIAFNGSGDVDGVGTASFFAAIVRVVYGDAYKDPSGLDFLNQAGVEIVHLSA